jgi:hypothetical protein
MRDSRLFLCSELVMISTGTKFTVGNLDSIEAERCLECPQGGRKACGHCRFKGQVRSLENDPVLGHLIHIDFEGRMWSPEEWEPGHLVNIQAYCSAPR